jgi:hypothetical protein
MKLRNRCNFTDSVSAKLRFIHVNKTSIVRSKLTRRRPTRQPMPEPRDQRVTHRREPTRRWHRHQPTQRFPPNPPLSPQDLREGKVAAERLPLGDEIDATGGLSFRQSELGDVDELPRVNLDGSAVDRAAI